MRAIDLFCSLLIPIIILLHLYLAPYTKVEESFNLQATHDILSSGIPWSGSPSELEARYDHFQFPGPVPRTFVGALFLASVSKPFLIIRDILGLKRFTDQFIVRSILGLSNAICFIIFRNGISSVFGRYSANCYALFQATQFHTMFYASRTLPNFFALGPVIIATTFLLPTHIPRNALRQAGLMLLTVVGVVFRSELAILLGAHALLSLSQTRIGLGLRDVVSAGFSGAVVGLLLTVSVDTLFWRSKYPLWPEFSAFMYNIVSGRSADWGVSPWYWYFTSSIPRLLMNPMIFICIIFSGYVPALRSNAVRILAPNIIYIIIYSFQPHKEWRFIIYTVPSFLATASAGAGWIWTRRTKSLFYSSLSFLLMISVATTSLASLVMLLISRTNYPGGQAVDRLHEYHLQGVTGNKTTHMDTLTCMTGATRFLQRTPSALSSGFGHAIWNYDKTEDPAVLTTAEFWQGIDYVLMEYPQTPPHGSWQTLDTINGYDGITFTPRVTDSDVKELQSNRRSQVDESGKFSEAIASLLEIYKTCREVMMKRFTRDRWPELQIRPKIQILQRQSADAA